MIPILLTVQIYKSLHKRLTEYRADEYMMNKKPYNTVEDVLNIIKQKEKRIDTTLIKFSSHPYPENRIKYMKEYFNQ